MENKILKKTTFKKLFLYIAILFAITVLLFLAITYKKYWQKYIELNRLQEFLGSNIGSTITTAIISLCGVLFTGFYGNKRLERLKRIYNSQQKSFEIVHGFFNQISKEYFYIFDMPDYEHLSEQFEIFQLNFSEKMALENLLVPDSIYIEFRETLDKMDTYIEDNYQFEKFKRTQYNVRYFDLEAKRSKSQQELSSQYKILKDTIIYAYDIFKGKV